MRTQVIISRMLVTLLVIMTAAGASAQSRSYRNAIRDYVAMNGQYSKEQQEPNLLNQNPNLFESGSSKRITQLTSRYINEQYIEDMIDLMEIVFSDEVTESDLRTAISLLSTPEGKAMTKHNQAWSVKFEVDFSSEIQIPFSYAQAGRQLKPIYVSEDIPTKYAINFEEYFDNIGGADTYVHGFNQGVALVGGEVPESFQTWLEENVCTIAMNSAYGTITLSDLEYASQLYRNPSYCKVYNASMTLVNDMMMTGSFVLLRYIDWMQEHGATLSDMGVQMMAVYSNYLENL